MKRIVYHMIVEDYFGKRKEYLSTTQGSSPAGWKCVGVCGFHEEEKLQPKRPCIGCVYFRACGSTTRIMPCEGRKTKTEVRKEMTL